MSGFAVVVDASGFQGLTRRLDEIEGRIAWAIAYGINEGGDKVRTQVQRGLQQQSGLLRYGSVLQRTRTLRAYGANVPKSGIGPVQPAGGLTYEIIVRGKPATKIDEFSSGVKTGKGGYVWAKMWGVTHVFQRSFQSPDRGLLRARLGDPRFPIRGFDGPNLAKELGKGIVPGRFYATAAFEVPPAIIKQLSRVL